MINLVSYYKVNFIILDLKSDFNGNLTISSDLFLK